MVVRDSAATFNSSTCRLSAPQSAAGIRGGGLQVVDCSLIQRDGDGLVAVIGDRAIMQACGKGCGTDG